MRQIPKAVSLNLRANVKSRSRTSKEMSNNRQHVVAGHSSCGWTTKQVNDLPKDSVVVMCDKNPDDSACKGATAFPTHLVCTGKDHTSCTEIGKGYKPASELQSLI
jgi:hypothetical protein